MMRQIATRPAVFIALFGLLLSAQQASASPWPRFRGPNGTGVATDKEIPVAWTDKDGMLWKTRIPGLGHSSPIVWGERVFLQSASEDGKERFLLCLDASNGKTIWTRSIPGSHAHIHALNSRASSTPATDGERIYTLFWDGIKIAVHAFDFQGKHLWSRDLGLFKSQHGAGTSPLVYAGKVIIANDHDDGATVYALDVRDGTVIWQASRPHFRACYSTPFVLEKPGRSAELIVASTAGITSYDPKSGRQYWNYTWSFTGMPLRTVACPVYSDGLIIANSGDGSGARHLIAVKDGGTGDVSQTNLAWEWSKERPFPYVPTMLTWGEHLYFVNDRGDAGCVAAKTGDPVWIERLCPKVMASPILIDGKIYVISESGVVYVFKAETSFKLLAKNPLSEPVSATPAVSDNRLYIRGEHHLFCIGKPSERRAARE